MTSNVRAVLFDWDGTLVDTAEATFRCYVRLFTELGVAFDRETYARTYSPNWHQTFRMLDIPEERWPHADARWLEHFAEEQFAVMDGARELLDALHARGLETGIVTSGNRERVRREVGLHQFTFRECVYGCDVKEKKPHPEGLLLCLDRMRIDTREAVYVGDSPEDIAMARAAGVYSIAVPGGYPNRDALIASRPDAFADSLREVWSAVAEYSRRREPSADSSYRS